MFSPHVSSLDFNAFSPSLFYRKGSDESVTLAGNKPTDQTNQRSTECEGRGFEKRLPTTFRSYHAHSVVVALASISQLLITLHIKTPQAT